MKVYSQPKEYHFSRNSIELVEFVSKDYHQLPLSILDLCSGCGVIAIEYYLRSNSAASFSFIELQSDVFKKHLEENIRKSSIDVDEIHFVDFRNLESTSKFDLILCNPPYFKAEKSRFSDNKVKNLCTHFNDNFFDELLTFTSKRLNKQGKAYILCRSDFLEEDFFSKWKDYIEVKKLDTKTDVIIFDQTGYIDS